MEQARAEAEQITFYSHWLPALSPGEYAVSVTPQLTSDGTALATEAATETFHVGGPRYTLTGSEAYSCYPAPGQIGQFYDTLPHIVFDRCTLPWERRIDGSDPTVAPTTGAPEPWLTLILLTDADFSAEPKVDDRRVPPIVARTLGQLLSPGDGVIGPAFRLDPKASLARPGLDPYDSLADPCQTIDLPAGVFTAVLPRKRELPYLAHVREVKTDHKESWSLLKEGKFSVVVGNRFPETQATATGEKDWGIVNTVCVVSLEGWGDYLKPDSPHLEAGQRCRLLVLASWRFTCQGSSAFKSLMEHLDDTRLLGRPPLQVDHASAGDDAPALAQINTALEMGFVPVNHDLRNSDTTISWYRGPLVPMSYERSMSYADISCADTVLRYDDETGMFDASYAAAWQLGRLLALQDQAFGQALHRFRTEYQRWVRSANTAALRAPADAPDGRPLGLGLQDKLGKRGNIRDWYAQVLGAAGYLGANRNVASVPNSAAPPPIPATVQNWLGQAMLLYGVPFHYLVPDEAMLPAEPAGSIRFFYLNPEWINSMLQGACSVGRASETDELADQLLRARLFDVSERMAHELRSSAKAAADRRRGGTDDTGAPAPSPDDPAGDPSPAVLHWPLSGYLLRSAAVESWIGLEARATGTDSTGKVLAPLQILRMDRLAPDILLCLYNGNVTEIEVAQPPEAIHFGAASTAAGGHEKTLRKIKNVGTLNGSNTVDVVEVQRVVQVHDLATTMKTKLVASGQIASDGAFTSAEFAVQMIESSAKVTFTAQ